MNTATPCSAMGTSTAIFVARVIVDSGEGWGKGPARVVIEEGLSNTPKDVREVDIDTDAGTSCYYRLRAGERYVVFASVKAGDRTRFAIGACSNTFRLRGNEHILQALRNTAQGGPSRIVGTVRRSTGFYSKEAGVEGAVVKAVHSEHTYTAVSGPAGSYEILNVLPGVYQLEVSKAGFVPDTEFNRRWSGRLVLDRQTNTVGPDKSEVPGSIVVGDRSCTDRDLSLWPNGRISGRVMNTFGRPVVGISVQAFAFDARGEREFRPLRTAQTDNTGKYNISSLPSGSYIIGVNAEMYRDADAYPPTLFSKDRLREEATKLFLSEGQEISDIDLELPSRRSGTSLHVQVLDPSGQPRAGAVVSLRNMASIQRWHSGRGTPENGALDVPVYIGEQYVVEASVFDGTSKKRGYDYLSGSTVVKITNENPEIMIVLSARRFADQ